MKKIGILTGVDSEFENNEAKDLGINLFEFVINWDGPVKPSDVYSLMRSGRKGFPKTSQPSVVHFSDIYKKKLDEYEELLVITISSKFSGTFNAAIQAKKNLDEKLQTRIHVFDSEVSSGAEALLVFAAIDAIKKGENISDIIKKLKEIVSNLNLVGVFDDSKWLVAGGRINAIKGVVVNNLLKAGVRPILTIKDGEIVVKKIQVNSRDKAEALFTHFCDDYKGGEVDVIISQSDCDVDAKRLKSLLENFSKSIKIKCIHEISPVVGCHLGPDTLLLSWLNS